HSLVQLFMEGPNDKFLTFLVPQRFRAPVPLADLFPEHPTLAALGGRDMADLLLAEAAGTATALAQAKRPSLTISFPQIGPAEIGALILLFEIQTVLAGRLWNVNPFDQPGVEAGKKNAAALLGQADLAGRRKELETFRQTDLDSWTLDLTSGGAP
ncbi:MAG: glucose-6-phosphate isomerase, partial [Candidatus Eisenbacteria bacterium]